MCACVCVRVINGNLKKKDCRNKQRYVCTYVCISVCIYSQARLLICNIFYILYPVWFNIVYEVFSAQTVTFFTENTTKMAAWRERELIYLSTIFLQLDWNFDSVQLVNFRYAWVWSHTFAHSHELNHEQPCTRSMFADKIESEQSKKSPTRSCSLSPFLI